MIIKTNKTPKTILRSLLIADNTLDESNLSDKDKRKLRSDLIKFNFNLLIESILGVKNANVEDV